MPVVDISPPKMSITNLRSGVEIVAQFNPTEFEEQVAPNFARFSAQGQSHEKRHFTYTGSFAVTTTLYFRAFSPAELDEIHRARRHLLSWAYPRRIGSDTVGGGPPPLLFVWPGMLALPVDLISARIVHEAFNKAGKSVRFRAEVTFEESRDTLLTTESVADDEELRFGAALAETDLDL